MAVDDRRGDVCELVAVVLRVVAQQLERLVGVDRMARHQDSLRLLDHRPAPECALQVVVLREALQRDVDRALQLLRRRVDDVGEDAALGRLVDVGGILRREQRDHRAGGLADDLRDQVERVVGGEAEPDERDVRLLARGDRGDLSDVDLAGDHLVAEPGDDLGEQLEPVAPLVRDQDAEVLTLVLEHRHRALPTRCVVGSVKQHDSSAVNPRHRHAGLVFCACQRYRRRLRRRKTTVA